MTATFDITLPRQSAGIAGLAVRIRTALEALSPLRAQPLSRDELQQRHALQVEARRAIAARDNSLNGVRRPLD